MEWQAGYASGAFLMPATFVRRLIDAYLASRKVSGPFDRESPEALELSKRVAHAFEVSIEASMVRLSQLSCLTD
jgi:hypothetical protein